MLPKIINNKNFFSLIIISTPFLSYSNANLISFNLLFASSVLLLLLGTIIIIFLLGRLLSLFIKKIDYKVFFLGLSFFFFTLFYSFPFFKNLLYKVTPIYCAEISLFISLIFLFFFLFFFFSEKKNFIKYFILIYFYTCFIADAGILIVNNVIFLSQKDTLGSEILFNEKGIEYIKKNKKKNMYFVIVDAAIALDKFDENYKTNHFSFYIPKFKELGFDYIKNTKSAYHSTVHNLTSLFSLNYHITEQNYKNYPITNFYPLVLTKEKIDGNNLINNLKIIKYKFRWKGTPLYDCEAYNLNLCLQNSNASKKKVIMDSRVTKTFLQRSPLTQIYVKIKTILGITAPEIFFDIKKADSLHVFMNKMDNFKLKNQGYFFLIHSLPPHPPYVFDSNCNVKKKFEFLDRKKINYLQKVVETGRTDIKAYKEGYECMLKRVYEFINFINKNDSDANVIITSDHGHQIIDYFYLMYDTFTLVKINKKCKKNISDNLNLPNATRLLLGCTVEQRIKMLEKKSYFVDFERGNFSIGGKLRIKKINQNNYGNIF